MSRIGEITVIETCSCGDEFHGSGFFSFIQPLLHEWRQVHEPHGKEKA